MVAGVGARLLGLDPIGDVAADALHLGAGRTAHRDFAPRDPARTVAARDPLVVGAGAVSRDRARAFFEHGERERRADDLVARAAAERAEGVVGVGDAAGTIAADNRVALRGKKGLGPLFRFLE